MSVRKALTGGLAAALLSGSSAWAAVEWTLLVAPARYSVLQVMFDVLRHRPAVLVAFQGDAHDERPTLHVWNGEEWAPISLRDLAEARFVQTVPTRVVLIGDETVLPPVVAEATAWCARTAAATSLDTAGLVNDLGHLFQFSRSEWAWFAARYNLTLKDRSAETRSSWYDRPENAPPPPRLPLFRRRRAVPPAAPIRPAPDAAPAPSEDALAPAMAAPSEPAGAVPESAAPDPAPQTDAPPSAPEPPTRPPAMEEPPARETPPAPAAAADSDPAGIP